MKSTAQRDIYAQALENYQREVPVEKWSTYQNKLSKSGLARELQKRGFPSFDRKRLESSACAPLFQEMEREVESYLAANQSSDAIATKPAEVTTDREAKRLINKLQRKVEQLEKDLKAAERREKYHREKSAIVQEELEQLRRNIGSIEEHSLTSLRTLHLS